MEQLYGTTDHHLFFKNLRLEQQRAEQERLEARKRREADWAKKAPIMQGLADDLAAVFRKYGVYVELNYEDIRPIDRPIVVQIDDSDLFIRFEGDARDEHASIRATSRIPAPSAHDKLAVKALHARLIAEAQDRPAKGGAAS